MLRPADRWCASIGMLLLLVAGSVRADDWPQWLGLQRDGVWREKGIVSKFPTDGPPLRWRTPIGAGYAGPAVANGRVFVTDRILSEGVRNPDNAFAKSAVPGKERVLCLDEKTGRILWTQEYDCQYEISYAAGPRTTPVVHGDKVYTLGAMGDLLCLDVSTGKVLWAKNFPRDYQANIPIWGFAAHPLLDGDRLICLAGGPGSVVVAFNKDTGKEVWRALSAEQIGYCPPMIYEVQGRRELIIWHPEAVNGLDPQSGSVLWTFPWRIQSPSCMSISTPRFENGQLFLTSFYNGSTMLQLDAAKPGVSLLWRGKWWKDGGNGRSELSNKTDGLHSIISTPVLKDGTIYGVCSYGQLRALDARTGKRLWETFAATGGEEARWANAFLVVHEDHFFLFNEKGDLLIARLTPDGYQELSRAHLIEPTNRMAMGRPVVWTHPAFANRSVYVRNDKEIACFSLAAEGTK